LERRPTLSPNWSCRCCHDGKQISKTTDSPLIGDAKLYAEKWYSKMLRRIEDGEPPTEATLTTAYQGFINYHQNDLLKTGASNAKKIRHYKYTWNNVEPFLGDNRLSEITSPKLEAFRAWRQARSARPLTEKTLHVGMGLIRLVLKYADLPLVRLRGAKCRPKSLPGKSPVLHNFFRQMRIRLDESLRHCSRAC
jgi:hypothetical protein